MTLLAVSILAGCGADPTPPERPARYEIVPEAGDGIILARSETSGILIQGEEESIPSRVELPEDFVFISAGDYNLDLDDIDEQIVVVKRRDDPNDRVRILVTDFDTLRNTYRIVWEGETRAQNVRTFSLYTADVIGDHLQEIVCFGTDEEGRQSLDIFRRRQAGTVTGLSFREIFSAVADGSIEIEEQPRSDSYRTLQSTGASYPIQVYRRNVATDVPLDLVRSSWYWRAQESRYVLANTESIPAMEIEEAQLRELYNAESEEIELFLRGPWYRSIGEEMNTGFELAYFNPETREIVLFRNDTQERYEWLNSYKTLYEGGPGLWMNLQNEVLGTVRRQLSITVRGLDSLLLSMEGAEYWNGEYRRMTEGIQAGILRRYEINTPDFELSGIYRNENNEEFLFDRPYFSYRSDDHTWSGGYNLVEIGVPVIELKVMQTDDDESFNRSYSVEYREQGSEGQIVRTLRLTPVELTVDGPRGIPGDPIVLEQVREIES